ncbi:MAG: dihydrodipicolinate synthase family protein [Thermomicrobiales bacterium]
MAAKPLGGVYAPVATLFDGDGELDLVRYAKNLDWYCGTPLDGIVMLGSNGEFAALDFDERLRLIEAGAEAIDGRKTVLAGTGAESTKHTIHLTREAARLGVEYALVVTPHYYRPRYDRQAYLNHYQAVAEASPIPVLVYIMTTYTGVDLATDIVAELSQHPNIAGVKDSAGSAPKLAEMVAKSSDDFAVLAGSASFLYPALCVGAKGGIVALGNVAPRECAELYDLFQAGKHDEARALQHRLLDPNAAVTSRFGIAGLKAAMDIVGLETSDPRPPQRPASDEERAAIEKIFDDARLLASA